MARPCVICTHPQRLEIDTAIGMGTNRGLAPRYGISMDCIQRHTRNHLGPAVLAATVAREELTQATIVERLRALQAEADALLERAKAADDLQAAGRLIDQSHKILVSLGKTLSMFATTTTVNDNRRLTINSPSLTESQWRALAVWAEAQTALPPAQD